MSQNNLILDYRKRTEGRGLSKAPNVRLITEINHLPTKINISAKVMVPPQKKNIQTKWEMSVTKSKRVIAWLNIIIYYVPSFDI